MAKVGEAAVWQPLFVGRNVSPQDAVDVVIALNAARISDASKGNAFGKNTQGMSLRVN
jgi:hypothetical protein